MPPPNPCDQPNLFHVTLVPINTPPYTFATPPYRAAGGERSGGEGAPPPILACTFVALTPSSFLFDIDLHLCCISFKHSIAPNIPRDTPLLRPLTPRPWSLYPCYLCSALSVDYRSTIDLPHPLAFLSPPLCLSRCQPLPFTVAPLP